MDTIKSFFSSKTKRGRVVRTTLQAFLGVLSFMLGLLTIPGMNDLLQHLGLIETAGALGVWVGVVSYLYNTLETIFKQLYGTER